MFSRLFDSLDFDLTLTQQQIAKLPSKQLSLWQRANEKFFWNKTVVSDLIAAQADEWIIPFTSAHIEYHFDCSIESSGATKSFSLLFISRRSRHRQGCRFTKRGIDEQGNVGESQP